MPILSKLLIFTFALTLGACEFAHSTANEGNANRIAAPVWMVERQIPANAYEITAYERIHEEHTPASIYIEGDGQMWLNPSDAPSNPTPTYPLGLHLASKDLADNVIYLARPCQYTKMLDPKVKCDKATWTDRRFGPEVISAMDAALDNIKFRYNIPAFHLIGYDGGGAVAALVAAQRNDILTIRSVAANMDHIQWVMQHDIPELKGSLNPPDFAENLSIIPQRHFVGAHDGYMPWAVIDSYLNKLGKSNCVSYSFVEDADHKDGWVNQWQDLLKEDVTCTGVPRDTIFRPMSKRPPRYVAPLDDKAKGWRNL